MAGLVVNIVQILQVIDFTSVQALMNTSQAFFFNHIGVARVKGSVCSNIQANDPGPATIKLPLFLNGTKYFIDKTPSKSSILSSALFIKGEYLVDFLSNHSQFFLCPVNEQIDGCIDDFYT
ncbi:hypothetical protein D3C77_377880 [compost metagenome]